MKLSDFFYQNKENGKVENSEFSIKLTSGNLSVIRGEISSNRNDNKYSFICNGDNFEPNGGVLDTVNRIVEQSREKTDMEKINRDIELWYENREELLTELIVNAHKILQKEGKEKLVEYIENSPYEIFPV